MRIVGGGDDDNQSGIGWQSPLTMVDKYQISYSTLCGIVQYCKVLALPADNG